MDIHFHAHLSGKLDRNKGTIRDVSIISEGIALGHGVAIDKKTLSQIFESQKSQPLSAYWTHGEGELGQEVGMFAGFHIDGNQLRAHFTTLDAFKKNFASRYDYLFELADKFPKNFGVSIHFSGDAVWVLEDGSEVPAGATRPANAVGDMPYVRVTKVYSADFVKDPAANSGGLFNAGKLTDLLDVKDRLSAELSELVAKLTVNGDALKAKESAFAELATKHDTATKTLEAAQAEGTARETAFAAQKTAFEAKVGELSAHIATLSTEIETRKNDAATKEAEHKAQIETMNKTLIEFGAVPVNIYSAAVDHAATFSAITDPVEKTRYWNKNKAAILRT